jgi:uncharacterized membrane-anchored protein
MEPHDARTLNKVPAIGIYFWVIKILCTTVGETAADYLNMNLHFGLTNTTYLMSVFLVAVLALQLKVRRYVPWIYWLAVVFISVVGTLITDNLTDNLDVPLTISTAVFSVALAVTFIVWYAQEKTLSILTINTSKREAFYWLAILFTFALGTAAGDLISEDYEVGYLPSLILFAVLLTAVTVAHFAFRLDAVVAFWTAYVLTRPLGASIGDYLTQDPDDGGLGLGITLINVIFFALILALVSYLTLTKKDVVAAPEREAAGA